jgi:hypothetical protein
MTQNNKNNPNNQNNQNRNKKNGQKQRTEEKEQKDKKVPMRCQIQHLKKTNSVKFKFTVDGTVEKMKLSVYKDGSDEAFLKMMKEFLNYVETHGIWDEENAARTVYRNFRRCLVGAARDLWDQIIAIEEEDEVREKLTSNNHLKEHTSAVLGDDALRNQKDCLKSAPKPNKMTVK